MERLLYGLDPHDCTSLDSAIGKVASPRHHELVDLAMPHFLGQPLHLPIREAIDWVHASIYTTIKTMKFSHFAPVCGGPVWRWPSSQRIGHSKVGHAQADGRRYREGGFLDA